MHALQWIADNGKYLRTIEAATLRKALAREKGHCTWCDAVLPKGKTRWCSQQCVEDFLIRNGRRAAWMVEQRDKGVCAACGLDTLKLKHRIMGMRYRALGYRTKSGKKRPYSWSRVQRLMRKHNLPYQPFEADHILPVVEGGGLCGLDNYRTLCIPCHKKETKALAARRARHRRDAKQVLLKD